MAAAFESRCNGGILNRRDQLRSGPYRVYFYSHEPNEPPNMHVAWYPRLFNATQEQRRNWRVGGAGYGIHWPDLDKDLSTEGLLRGAPSPPEPVETSA